MGTVFMNSENSKTSDSFSLLSNLSDKLNLKRSDKINMVFYQIFTCSVHWESHISKIDLKN